MGFAFRTLTLGLVALSVGCVQPVRRDAEKSAETAVTATPSAAIESGLKKRLWILRFTKSDAKPTAKSLKGIDAKDVLARALVKAFSAKNMPFVVEVQDAAGVYDLTMDSGAPVDDIVRTARGSAMGGFVTGNITEFSYREKVLSEGLFHQAAHEFRMGADVELYDAITGRKVYAGNVSETHSETKSQIFVAEDGAPSDLPDQVDTVARALADKIAARVAPHAEKIGWQGRVVKLDGQRVYVNAGHRTGLQIGDTLRVVDVPKEVIDPQSGVLVGRAPGRLKATLKIIGLFGVDGAMAVLQSGGGVVMGDVVELY